MKRGKNLTENTKSKDLHQGRRELYFIFYYFSCLHNYLVAYLVLLDPLYLFDGFILQIQMNNSQSN